MIARRLGISILVVGALALLLISLLSGRYGKSWQATGTVVGFGAEGTSVFIAHGEIPGLMPAMTMPFSVETPEMLESLEVQDSVSFQITISNRETVAERFVVLRAGNAGTDIIYHRNLPAIGTKVPEILLTDMVGSSVNLGRLETHATLLTFIYTSCPLPDFCPLMSRRFQELQKPLIERYGEDVGLLSISFDPERDTPSVLRSYANRYTRDTSNWRFATGSSSIIREATDFFGVTVESDGILFDHNLTTALIDSSGAIHAMWPGNDWHVADVLGALAELIPRD